MMTTNLVVGWLWSFLLAFLLCAVGFSVVAQNKQYAQGRSSARVSDNWLSKACDGDVPTKNREYDRVVLEAKVNALRSWASQRSVAFTDLFSQAESVFLNDIDRYLLNPYLKYRCGEGVFFVSVRGEINEAAVTQLVGSKKPEASGPRSRMTAVFVSRRQVRVKSFDDKTINSNEDRQLSVTEEAVVMAGAGISASKAASQRTVAISGGSVERKADQILYEVFQADGLDAAVNQTFSSNGYRVVDSSQAAGRFEGFDLDAFRRDFGVGEDLKPQTKEASFNALSGRIPILAVATVDVLKSDKDPVSGLSRVYVSVKAWVYRDDGLFYVIVAAVEPTQQYATGPNDTVAQTSALVKAAKLASNEIVNQLNAKGIY
jgi:hypothetical protein